jgi:outer membrane protein OmpA-like peptidoglycan-associated protein/tetratricopeptide (TPR) repeat protein
MLFACFVHAQDTIEIKNLKAGQAKRLGNSAIVQGDYHAAEEYFNRYTQLKPNNAKGAYKLAEAYRINRDYVSAQEWYDKACKLSGENNAMALYYYGLMLKMNGNCDKAKEQFAKFKKKAGRSKEASDLKKQMKAEITGCDSAIAFTKQLNKVSVTHLDTTINKIHVEHAPVMLDTNTLLYSSVRTDKKVYTIRSEQDTAVGAYKKFYTAKKVNGKWTFDGEYDGNDLNKEGFNNTNAAFSADGKRLYFTRCKPDWKNKMICAIYLSTKQDDGNWSDPVGLDPKINNPKYTSTQPTTSLESVKQNEVIYFVSDRPGGRGGLDIWYIIYDFKKKTYSLPKNAGSKVNTSGDEITPYYDGDNRTLFFSSNGWPGLGGLDIFKAKGEMKRFTEPENIGAPINSTNDDIYYTESKNKEEGFFVSNRKGGVAPKKSPTCCDDIYAFKKLQYLKLNVEGVVTDEKGNPLKNTKVSLYSKTGDAEPIFIKSVETDADGKYSTTVEAGNDYKLIYEKDKFLNGINSFTTKGITTSQAMPQNTVVLKEINDKPFVLTNVHYGTDRHDLSPEAKKDIDTTLLAFLIQNPEVIVEVSSHTDDEASDAYNNSLSKKRAEGVVQYLVSKGISLERLQFHGYGETRPIADNKTKEGRAANRRTEFKILGKLPPKEKEYNEKE